MALSIALIIVIANWGLCPSPPASVQPKPGSAKSTVGLDGPRVRQVCRHDLAGGDLRDNRPKMAVMWILGAFSNEPRPLARYGGFFKAMPSAGLCVTFCLEAGSVSYVSESSFWLH
jgi:hypothetical protein